MTSPRQFPLSELIDEMRLLVAGREDWLARARKGEIERTEFEIAHKARGLERMKAIGNLLLEFRKSDNGENKNNKAGISAI